MYIKILSIYSKNVNLKIKNVIKHLIFLKCVEIMLTMY